MKAIITIFLLLLQFNINAQNHNYTTANAHSHNDYEQRQPFWAAYNAGFGSVEADIFLLNDSLFVAHDIIELAKKRSFEDLYLNNLQTCILNNKGSIYPGKGRQLQLLIDVKTDAKNTLAKLLQVLKRYPTLINCKTLHFVISGNRPDQNLFTSYPGYISFDGELKESYNTSALSKIVMLSSDFKNFSSWSGKNDLSKEDEVKILAGIAKAHRSGKKVRFWDAPDNPIAWRKFIDLKSDFINTDMIGDLASFLHHKED